MDLTINISSKIEKVSVKIKDNKLTLWVPDGNVVKHIFLQKSKKWCLVLLTPTKGCAKPEYVLYTGEYSKNKTPLKIMYVTKTNTYTHEGIKEIKFDLECPSLSGKLIIPFQKSADPACLWQSGEPLNLETIYTM